MNKSKILHTISATAMLLSLASCSQDEADILLDGKHTLEIASATIGDGEQSMTRVAENTNRMSSSWQTGDIIYVKPAGATTIGTFRYNASGTFDKVQPTYWTQTTEDVDAWMPANGTVSLANQSSSLAYVLKASAANAPYNKPVSLQFSHQLAKVRVVAEGSGAENVTTVKLKSYTSCTNTQGTVSNGKSDGWITMMATTYNSKKCWEANVVPGKEISEVDLYGIPVTLSTPVTPTAGKVSTITLKVNRADIDQEYDLSKATEPINITDDGHYFITGTGSQPVNITGNATVEFSDAKISSATPVVIDGNVSAKLIFKGENTVVRNARTYSGMISLRNGASVDISGDGTLNVDDKGSSWNSYMGAVVGGDRWTDAGDISISGITLNIQTCEILVGIGGGPWGSCGNITITNAIINIPDCVNTGIGASPTASSCGNITIKNSDININIKNNNTAIGGGTVEGIYITLKAGQTQQQFLDKLTVGEEAQKVGGGTITNGVHWYNADGSEIN